MNKAIYAPAKRIIWRNREIRRVFGPFLSFRKMLLILITIGTVYMLWIGGEVRIIEENIKKPVEMQSDNLIKWGVKFDKDGIHIYRSERKYD